MIAVLFLSVYAVLVTGLLAANHRARQQRPTVMHRITSLPPVPEPVRWLPTLPPVPPTRSELEWLASQPAEVLTGVALRWKFEQVVSGEKWAVQ